MIKGCSFEQAQFWQALEFGGKELLHPMLNHSDL